MEWIKKIFIGHRVSKQSRVPGKHNLVKFDRIKNISIIAANEAEATEAQKALPSHWPHALNLHFIYKEKNPATECFDYMDFNLLGKPNEKIREFASHTTDLVLVTQEEMDPLSAHLLQMLPKVYRVGFFNEANQVHLDFMLKKENISLTENIDNLIKYLKKIN
ncbi:hypothetical protein KI659_03810 [Litoribacter alkaliphilus]|uniref:Uncharacterized protein n=1 Tax=Litoribacter ruber TaxID=702568 RepID=A0AAP2CH57_9BACT|nr:hypothetical protein [Litoribacter alkaliphilus]MBS9523136.1 hypothetical protein [Litoribacter alkaliphilus]